MDNLSINTKRLKLTPLETSDHSLFLDINTDPFVRRYLWDDEMITSEMVGEILEINQKHFQEDQYGLWKILNTDQTIIGYVGLWHFFDEAQPQLIYALLEPFTGKGYAHEAGLAIIEYTFKRLKFKYLLAATDEPHLASQKVALGLGMTLVGTKTIDGKPTLFYRIEKNKSA